MQVVLATLLLATGADPIAANSANSIVASVDHAGAGCDSCGGAQGYGGRYGGGRRNRSNRMSRHGGPMPQTCYAPRYGCYGSNQRHTHRYPAFHGTYYRRSYNYRNVFDYPWHAELHEPTSHFSYNVPGENVDAELQQDEPSLQPTGWRAPGAVRPLTARPGPADRTQAQVSRSESIKLHYLRTRSANVAHHKTPGVRR